MAHPVDTAHEAAEAAPDDWFDKVLFVFVHYPMLFVIALVLGALYYVNKMRLEEKKDKRWAIGELLGIHDKGVPMDETTLVQIGAKQDRRSGKRTGPYDRRHPDMNGRHEHIVRKD